MPRDPAAVRPARFTNALWAAAAVALAGGCASQGKFTSAARDRAEQRLADLKATTELDLAEQSLFAGSLEKAARQAERAARLDPTSAKARRIMGRVSLERDDIAAARRAFAEAAALDPADAASRYFAGVTEERVGNSEAALAHFAEAAALDPLDDQYAVARAEALVDLGLYGEAHEALSLSPASESSPGIHQLLGHLELLGGDASSAISHLETARLLAPSDACILEDLAGAQVAAGMFDRAAGSLDALLGDPDAAEREDLALLRARCRLASGRPDLARGDYLALTESRDASTAYRAWVGLGKAAFALGDYSALRRAASMGVQIDRAAPEGFVLWALWHHGRGDLAAAARSVSLGLELAGGSSDLRMLGVAIEAERRGEGDALAFLARSHGGSTP